MAATAVLLTGCQSDGGSGSSSDVTVLSEDELDDVLLSEDNVGPEFVVDDDDSDDDDSPGCLAAMNDLDDATDDVNNSEMSYAADNEVGFPSIFTGAASFESSKAVTDVVEDLASAFEDCQQVDETDDDGATYALAITTDTEKATDADQQLNVNVNGTISSDGLTLPFNLQTALVRVDNHLLMVATGDLEEEEIGLVGPLAEVAISRLQSVLDDEEPSDELVEAAAAGNAS